MMRTGSGAEGLGADVAHPANPARPATAKKPRRESDVRHQDWLPFIVRVSSRVFTPRARYGRRPHFADRIESGRPARSSVPHNRRRMNNTMMRARLLAF